MRKLNRKLVIKAILIYFLIPFIVSYFHIKGIKIEKTVEISKTKISGLSQELPKDNPTDIKNIKYDLESDVSMIATLDNIIRNSSFLGIQSDAIRHNIFLKHNISAKVDYSELSDKNNIKSEIFTFILSCDDNHLKTNDKRYIIKQGLKLNEQDNNDRKYSENIIKKCLFSVYGGFENNLNRSIYVHNIKTLPDSKVILIIEPDKLSQIFIILSWFMLWVGFMILLREGPGRIFKS